jgi:hypothetical protein
VGVLVAGTAVLVGVLDGVGDGVAVGVLVLVGDGVAVFVGVDVRVFVGVGVELGIAVLVGVGVVVGTAVLVLVGTGVEVYGMHIPSRQSPFGHSASKQHAPNGRQTDAPPPNGQQRSLLAQQVSSHA